ncbi:MAG: S41 family peptidase [Gammaproteobacteria bacterium]
MNPLRIKGLLPLCTGLLVGFTLAFSLAHSLGTGSDRWPDAGHTAASTMLPGALPVEDTRVLTEIVERVKQEYVEPVSEQQLMENAVRGMVGQLDSHSRFLDPRQYEEIQVSTRGAFTGVGLEVQSGNGNISVVSIIEDTAAARAGIRAGDVILGIDDEPVAGVPIVPVIRRMRGPAGSHVRLTIARNGQTEPLSFELVRGPIALHSVHGQILSDGFGYLRISRFSDTTGRDLRREIADLNRQTTAGLRGLVLDLRDNPGGVLDAAVEVSDSFLERGLIVTATGRARDATFRRSATPGDLLAGAPIVVLVNGSSASASEIVAAALQDHHRATIVGTRTFGKGSVQTVMPLSGGRAIKLTTSRYFSPSGESLQGRGITPDVPATFAGDNSDLRLATGILARVSYQVAPGKADRVRSGSFRTASRQTVP